MPAVALNDHNNLFASLEFSLKCAAAGIQPITGTKIVVRNYDPSSADDTAIITLLVRNQTGYLNLLRIISAVYKGRKEKQGLSIDLSYLLQNMNGLIVLLNYSSPLAQLLSSEQIQHNNNNDNDNAASNFVQQLSDATQGNVFIEIHRHRDKKNIEGKLIHFALTHNIDLVATNPVKYLTREMHRSHDALLCIANNTYVMEESREFSHPEEYYKSADEMRALFADMPEAIDNTALIAQKCSFMPEMRTPLLPKFDQKEDEFELLQKEAKAGLEKRITSINIDQQLHTQYRDRLEFELNVIKNMGYPGYFLIVSDFVKWSKLHNVAVGPGRGSGAGSIVAWALEITDINPLQFDLLFERFLNPDRVSLPDFDIDFCQFHRDDVIEYIKQKYGETKVAHIITFGKLQARAVVRDVGRVLQMPYYLVDKISKMIPHNPAHPITLQEAIDVDKELRRMRSDNKEIETLLNISLDLEGVNRHVSTHAAGILIADRDIEELVPLYHDGESDMMISQYSMKYAEAAGLMKFDFLGLKTLTVIVNTCNSIKRRHNIEIKPNELELTDEKTYKMLSDGLTVGVFQFEGFGMRDAIKLLKPDCIEDLIALASLYRPGPMDNIPHYINRKHGTEEIDYIHPLLTDTLKETYGIIVYQEQVMQIAQILANYTLGEADILRRAMGKKNKEEMRSQKINFIEKAAANGIDKQDAEEIFNLVEKFASYGFNKSHAAAYSVISYQTAYLKANYPMEFLSALINLDIHDTDKVHILIVELNKFNIKILPPSINKSGIYFSIENDHAVRFGLLAIKSAGIKVLQAIVEERENNGKFKDIFDFIKRTSTIGLNKRILEALINSGALTEIYDNSARLMQNIDTLLRYSNSTANPANTQQITLLGFPNAEISDVKQLKDCNPWSFQEKTQAEYSSLGFYLTNHPLEPFHSKLQTLSIVPLAKVESYATTQVQTLSIAGVLISKKIRSGKRNKFAFLQVSDQSGLLDVSIFDDALLSKTEDILNEGALLFFDISLHRDNGGLRIIANNLQPVEKVIQNVHSNYDIHIDDVSAIQPVIDILRSTIETRETDPASGEMLKHCRVILHLEDEGSIHFTFNQQVGSTYILFDNIVRLSAIKNVRIAPVD